MQNQNERLSDLMLEVLTLIGDLALRVEKRDRDLARQMRRAATSMHLNFAEGYYSTGGTQRARFENALGSAAETRAAVQAVCAMRYVTNIDARIESLLERVIGGLYRATH